MWHDNETTIDYLNFGVVADACANLLQQANGAPISVGISGGWGVGKSSLVRMIAERLAKVSDAGTNRYVVVTFNPWLYQDFDGARSALLQLVADQVLLLASENVSLLEKAKRFGKRVNLLRLVQMGGDVAATIFTGLPFGLLGSGIQKLMGGQSEGSSVIKPAEPISLPTEIQAFRDALEELLSDLKITLVVFVDDLDRCLPKTAIATLESIRLLLFLKRSAFVIAADNEFIRGAVRVHFEGTGITSDIATNYFDKLIQVPLHVPRLGVNEAKAYLALLLMERANSNKQLTDEKFDNAKNAIPERLRASWRGDAITTDFLHTLVGVADTEMTELMDLAEGLAPLLTQSSAVNANPRLMKRFLNTVFLRLALAKPQGIDLDIRAMAKWHLLERCEESLANWIASLVTAATNGRCDALRAAETAVAEGEEPADRFTTQFAKEWLQLKPALGQSDLRPLLHLSRDTATRDFGADNMNQESRQLRDALVSATSSNPQLTSAIQACGQNQTGMAMEKAWQINSPRRTWKLSQDVLMLVECCKIYPSLGDKARSLLECAPAVDVGPGLIPLLAVQTWAQPFLDKLIHAIGLTKATKNAISTSRARS